MRRSYRYRLYPTRHQAEALDTRLAEACDLYNAALEHRRRMWQDHGVSVTFREQSAELRELRAAGLLDSAANFWSQQAVLRRLDRAFAAFFRRVGAGEAPGYPRFKSRHRYNALEFSFAGHSGGIELTAAGRLRVQGVVGHVKVRLHRPIPAEAKLCEARVSRRNGRWYASISLEGVSPAPLPATGRAVGLDMGITTFVATSDGELIVGPRAGRASATSVRRAQRKVARRTKGSRRRRKAALMLVRRREHEANVRRDHAHKTARSLIARYDTIAIENLNCRGLARGMLAKDCNDQAWAAFVALLGERAEEAARRLVLIDPKHTSQECPEPKMLDPHALWESQPHHSATRAPARIGRQPVEEPPERPVQIPQRVLRRLGGNVGEPRDLRPRLRQVATLSGQADALAAASPRGLPLLERGVPQGTQRARPCAEASVLLRGQRQPVPSAGND